jgi:signal transduction histidine kinase
MGPAVLRAEYLSAERFLRAHPRRVATLSLAAVAVIAAAQWHDRSDSSLGLSYAVPLWLFAYAVGLVPGLILAAATAALWVFDLSGLAPAPREAAYVFAFRLLTNIGLVIMATVTASAAGARDRHLAAQQALHQLRRNLVAAFSHDLRNPLGVVVTYLRVLKSARITAPEVAQQQIDGYLDDALANARQVDRLLREMMGVEQSDTTTLSVSAFPPLALVAELQTEFSREADRQDVALLWEVAPDTPEFRTDRVKLTSIVRNLVSNGLKFTRHGAVTVRIGYDLEPATHYIQVEDTGCGIAVDALPHIFTRFYRAPDAAPIAGFGFGLFVVKSFTELLGGSIRVVSQVGRGTSFVVIVPHRPEPLQQADSVQ